MRPNAGDVDGLPSVLANHSNEFVGMLVATQLEKLSHFPPIFGQSGRPIENYKLSYYLSYYIYTTGLNNYKI